MMAERPSYRLPREVRPLRYTLEITPDIEKATFDGTVSVNLEVIESVLEIVVNAVNIIIHEAYLEISREETLPAEVTYREEDEQVVFTFSRPIPVGQHVLHIRYQGMLAEDLRGFYRTRVTRKDGSTALLASTQCEATDARRVFPGWDEPDLKAQFAISLIVDRDVMALSNARETKREDVGAHKVRVTFAETMPMSTYLVALVVAPFHLTTPIMVDDIPIRIAARPELMHLTEVAEEAARDTLAFFQHYFGIPYPTDKIDHVAIPEFAAGAMENLGCVTYREEALLIDRGRSSPMERMSIVSVIAHETAHMWFGDLVTMRWWNGIWLNEAFATFMQTLATDALHPEWDVWAVFGPSRAYALAIDGLISTRPIEYPVGPPSEAWGMFDALTYQKGGAVLRMMEQYLGSGVFQQGVHKYLERHQYGNTETSDLWDALRSASGQPVREVMDSWVLQEGYPVVRVDYVKPGQIKLSQNQFRYVGSGENLWQIPIVMGIGRVDGTVHTEHLILGQDDQFVTVPNDMTYLMVNQGGWGFYRVAYGEPLWDRLMNVDISLTPLERLGLVDDVWAMVLAGVVPFSQAVRLWRTFEREDDPSVWSSLFGQMRLLDGIATDDERKSLQTFISGIARPLLQRLGWHPQPNEEVRQGRLRSLLIRLMGTIGQDPTIQQEARRRFYAHIAGSEPIHPELLTAIVDVVAASGGEDEWKAIYTEFKQASTPQDEKRYLQALADFAPLHLVERTLSVYQSSEVKIQDGTMALGRALANRHARHATWDLLVNTWDELTKKYPQFMLPVIIEPVAMIVEEDLADRTVEWFNAHPMPDIARHISQSLEFQSIHRTFAERIRNHLGSYLED